LHAMPNSFWQAIAMVAKILQDCILFRSKTGGICGTDNT
jgi:hypothetical protein